MELNGAPGTGCRSGGGKNTPGVLPEKLNQHTATQAGGGAGITRDPLAVIESKDMLLDLELSEVERESGRAGET